MRTRLHQSPYSDHSLRDHTGVEFNISSILLLQQADMYAAAHNRCAAAVNTVVDALGLLRHSTLVLPGGIELAYRSPRFANARQTMLRSWHARR
jgi:hypothetical protein